VQGFRSLLTNKKALEDIALAAIIILVGTASFGLGKLSRDKGSEVPSRFSKAPIQASVVASAKETSGSVVASRSGTTYYPNGCAGANRISSENKVIFESATEAETAGLHKSAQCK